MQLCFRKTQKTIYKLTAMITVHTLVIHRRVSLNAAMTFASAAVV